MENCECHADKYENLLQQYTNFILEDAKCKTEMLGQITSIERHLGRQNGDIQEHSKAIEELLEWKIEQDVTQKIIKEISDQANKERYKTRLTYIGIVGMFIANLIINLFL